MPTLLTPDSPHLLLMSHLCHVVSTSATVEDQQLCKWPAAVLGKYWGFVSPAEVEGIGGERDPSHFSLSCIVGHQYKFYVVCHLRQSFLAGCDLEMCP